MGICIVMSMKPRSGSCPTYAFAYTGEALAGTLDTWVLSFSNARLSANDLETPVEAALGSKSASQMCTKV